MTRVGMETLDDFILNWARSENRIWFWKPQWYWHGWSTLSPLWIEHDEFARRTLLLGWTITGRAIIPLWDCGDINCKTDAYENALEWMRETYNAEERA